LRWIRRARRRRGCEIRRCVRRTALRLHASAARLSGRHSACAVGIGRSRRTAAGRSRRRSRGTRKRRAVGRLAGRTARRITRWWWRRRAARALTRWRRRSFRTFRSAVGGSGRFGQHVSSVQYGCGTLTNLHASRLGPGLILAAGTLFFAASAGRRAGARLGSGANASPNGKHMARLACE